MTVITVAGAKKIAGRWVEEVGKSVVGFAGAYMTGSINWMQDDAAFPATSDIDITVVSTADELPERFGKSEVEGIALEAGVIALDSLDDTDAILCDYVRAGSFSKDCVLSDPTGRLAVAQAAVARDFGRKKWVRRRCEGAQANSLRYLRTDPPEIPVYDQVTVVAFGTSVMADFLLVAALRNPTVRKRYAAVRQMLAERGRIDVYERLLELLGCSDWSADQVAHHLNQLEGVFDEAAKIPAPGYRFASDITPAGKNISIGGSRELIDAGHHRDAVFYIVATHARCMAVFDQYGADGALEANSAAFTELIDDLGLETYEERRAKARLAEESYPWLWEVAEWLMDNTAGVRD